MRDFRDAKAMAQTLRDALKTKSITLTHSESLEVIARTFGLRDWNVMAAAIQASRPVAAEPSKPPSLLDGNAALPIVPLRDIVVFPQMVVPLFVGRDKTKRAVATALAGDGRVLAVTQRRAADDDPGLSDLYQVGVTANVIRRLSMNDETMKVIVSGLRRVAVIKTVAAEFPAAEVTPIEDISRELSADTLALARQVLDAYEAYANASSARFQSFHVDPGMLADAIAPLLQMLSVGIDKMQLLLETVDVVKRLEMILGLMKASRQAA
jgi:ATP-dependent Lon protease